MSQKSRRWVEKDYTRWVAALPCSNCRIEDETIVAHHLKHRYWPYGGAGMGLKADDFLTMPLCYLCHDKAHNGGVDVVDYQAEFIFKTLTEAFKHGILVFNPKAAKEYWRYNNLTGEELYD